MKIFLPIYLDGVEICCIFAIQNDINMIIPRELIYVEKRNIREFGIYDKESPNHLIYEKWLLNQTDLKPFEPGLAQRRLKVFNDAYYICTLIMMHPTSEDFASYAKARCTMPSIVFPMVYFYISKVIDRGYSNSRLLEDIKTGLKSEDWDDKLAELLAVANNYPRSISSLEFSQRQLTPELLSEMKWYNITDHYKKEDILKIVRYIAKDEKEWVMMLDAIRHAVSDYEWEYNKDLDYVDDEGQWHKEPRKDMSPTYQYIDELKGNYDEMSIHEEKSLTTITIENLCPVSDIMEKHTGVGDTKTDIPEELQTDKAQDLIGIAKKEKWLDDNLQPLISSTESALLAVHLAELLNIREVWKVFGNLWHRNCESMRSKYNLALGQKKSLQFQDKLKVKLK